MKKSIQPLAILFLFIFCSVGSFAQTETQNLQKYWFYHHRLLNDFMAKGDCQGCSEPMNERDAKDDTDTDPTPSEKAGWGDQTVALGHYLMVLATEFKLLNDNGQPTDSTVQELYYALKAFNRLDKTAETSLPGCNHQTPIASDLNGFFIRDDVPSYFLTQHPKLKSGVTSFRKVSRLHSDYADQNNLEAKQMSHDQVWYIVAGCALIRKCMYAGITYQNKELNDVTHNADIYKEADDIIGRIINYIKNNSWKILDPNTNQLVERGPRVEELSYGAAEAGCYVKNVNTNLTGLPFPVHTCNNYHDWITYADASIWMDYGYGIGNVIAIDNDDYKLQQLVAVGNSWWTSATAFIPDPISVTKSIFDPLNFLDPWKKITKIIQLAPVLPVNVSAMQLGVRAILRDNQHLTLMRQVLHGGSNLVPNSTYENIINTAPCEGPWCFKASENQCSSFEWSTTDRLHDPEDRGGKSTQGEYCGLDYLLYYNLYHIVNPSLISSVNLMDRVITYPFPTSGGVGSTSNPALIEAYNTITASNVINSNANVTYKAGTTISLKPGFKVTPGSYFRGTVKQYHCAFEPVGAGALAADNSETNKNSELMAYVGATNYVKPPRKTDNSNVYTSIDEDIKAYNEWKNNVANYSQYSDVQNAIKSAGVELNNSSMKPQSGILIHPNPSNGVFKLIFTDNNQFGVKEITIHDLFGKIIWSHSAESSGTIDVDISSVPNGVYSIKIINGLNEMNVQRIIKQ